MSEIYTQENTTGAYQLNWGLTVFWRDEAEEEGAWLAALREGTEPDGVRLLEHRFADDRTSQFLVSTRPDVSPDRLLWSLKGRLQHALRGRALVALQRNYALRSIGSVTRRTVEDYVADQLGHHEMADERVQARLRGHQKEYREVALSIPRESAHGQYWYGLHIVLVNSGRWMEIEDEALGKRVRTIERVARKRGHALSRVAVLPDHVHLVVGCNVSESPEGVALSYMNNCAYACGMNAVFQFSYYVGTFGEYDLVLSDGSCQTLAPPTQGRWGPCSRCAVCLAVKHRPTATGAVVAAGVLIVCPVSCSLAPTAPAAVEPGFDS